MRLVSITPAVISLAVEITHTLRPCFNPPAIRNVCVHHHRIIQTHSICLQFSFVCSVCFFLPPQRTVTLVICTSVEVFHDGFLFGLTWSSFLNSRDNLLKQKRWKKINYKQAQDDWDMNTRVNRRRKWPCSYFPILIRGFWHVHFRELQLCVTTKRKKRKNCGLFFIPVTCDAITWREKNTIRRDFPYTSAWRFCPETSFSLELFCYKLD